MQINQEVGFTVTPKNIYQVPPAKHQTRSRTSGRGYEQPVEDLRATVESLQQIVCELLMENQILRMASSGTERSLQILPEQGQWAVTETSLIFSSPPKSVRFKAHRPL